MTSLAQVVKDDTKITEKIAKTFQKLNIREAVSATPLFSFTFGDNELNYLK